MRLTAVFMTSQSIVMYFLPLLLLNRFPLAFGYELIIRVEYAGVMKIICVFSVLHKGMKLFDTPWQYLSSL